ncbi:glutathione S-transferase 2-like [Nymphaea colorata]|nr:glutathione S-transferase 2-like [Nymphaea colorata]
MASHSQALDGRMEKLQLYSYWRSSCSWRVRIALNLKGLPYEYKPVNLLKDEQSSPEFTRLNPLGYVPVLADGDMVISDSFAILLYLEEKYPEHPILPSDMKKRALNLQVANIVGSSIQPLQNVSIVQYIEKKIGIEEKMAWAQKHIRKGFAAIEKLLEDVAGKYATGDEVYLADLFLAPQIYGAKRFNVDVSEFPTISRVSEAYKEHLAFQAALPENQPDAVKP